MMLLRLLTVTSASVLLAALLGILTQARPLFKRQQAPPPDTDTDTGNNGNGGNQTQLPEGLVPFEKDASNLTAWQVLETHPSFTNLSSIARAHSPAVVTALNSTDPGTNLTVFAPYDPAFESIIQQPLFNLANSTDRYDALITQALAYHVSNATTIVPADAGGAASEETGAVYTDDIPPAAGNVTLPTLAGNLNVTLQRADERPSAPVSISQQVPPPEDQQPDATVTLPTVQVPTATRTLPTPTQTQDNGQGAGAGGEQVGQPLPTDGPGVFVNEARIIYADVPLSNGVLHVVDRLISPLFIFNNPDLGQVLPTTLPTPTATQ